MAEILHQLVSMTDTEFLGYFVGGLDIMGHRITARVGAVDPHTAVAAGLPVDGRYFVLMVNHGCELPMEFDPGEGLESRMKKVDAAVARWRLLREA